MSRRSPLVLVLPAAAAALAYWRTRSAPGAAPWASITSSLRSRRGLGKDVETYPTHLVDLRGTAAGQAVAPPRAETPAEVVADFYSDRPPA